MKRLIITLSVLATCASIPSVSGAVGFGSIGSQFDVTANFVPACTVVTASTLSFGDIPNGSSPGTISATSDVSVTCSNAIAYKISLDKGGLLAGNYRTLRDATNTQVPYKLCKDAGLTDEWGDSDTQNTFPPGSSVPDTGNGAAQPHTVYGQILSIPSITGAYADTVNVTVDW